MTGLTAIIAVVRATLRPVFARAVWLQALFAGEYDIRDENIAKHWYAEYDNQPPVKEGLIKKDEIHHSLPAGMQAFGFVRALSREGLSERATGDDEH